MTLSGVNKLVSSKGRRRPFFFFGVPGKFVRLGAATLPSTLRPPLHKSWIPPPTLPRSWFDRIFDWGFINTEMSTRLYRLNSYMPLPVCCFSAIAMHWSSDYHSCVDTSIRTPAVNETNPIVINFIVQPFSQFFFL